MSKAKSVCWFKGKTSDLSGEEMLKHELAVQIGFRMFIWACFNILYAMCMKNGLIDESYAFDFSLEKGYGFAIDWFGYEYNRST